MSFPDPGRCSQICRRSFLPAPYHVVSELIVGRRDAKLPAHPDECAREHIDLGVASGVQILQGRIAGRWLDGTALTGHSLHPLHIMKLLYHAFPFRKSSLCFIFERQKSLTFIEKL